MRNTTVTTCSCDLFHIPKETPIQYDSDHIQDICGFPMELPQHQRTNSDPKSNLFDDVALRSYAVWKQWEYNANSDYVSLIQWLPEEVLDDVMKMV
jgi:hypothetical protein